jgi:hypothetical protein
MASGTVADVGFIDGRPASGNILVVFLRVSLGVHVVFALDGVLSQSCND